MPGIDPKDVNIEVAGSTLTIRAERPADSEGGQQMRYERSVTVPRFLAIDKVGASHRFGMLVLTLPLKESVKPRRIEIEGVTDEQKKLTVVA
jgi:HSP20 family protein